MKLDDVPSWNEIKKLVTYVIRRYKKGDIDLQHTVFFLFVFLSGMRISEILSLRKCDFDGTDFVRFKQEKKKRNYVREIIVPAQIRPHLATYLSELRQHEALFPWSRQNAWKLVKKLTKKVLGRGVRPHAFRHAIAIRLLQKTKDVDIVRRQLGHARLDITTTYLNYTLRDRKEEIEEALLID